MSNQKRHVPSRDLVLLGYDEHLVFDSLCRDIIAIAHDRDRGGAMACGCGVFESPTSSDCVWRGHLWLAHGFLLHEFVQTTLTRLAV